MDVGNLSDILELGSKGIWEAPKKDSISYAKNGHQLIKDCEEGSFWFKHRRDCVSLLFDKFNIKSLLDVGGGNGNISSYLQKKGIKCALLEPGDGILNAKLKGINTLINCSFNEARFKSNALDAIGIFDVLEHIEDDISFLKEINRTLKPDGQLILTVPAYQFLFSNFDKEVGHFRRYSLNNLQNKLKNCGFEINYNTYLFSPLPVFMYLSRLTGYHSKNIQNKRNREHFRNHNILNKLFGIILHPEKWFVKWGCVIPFGSSCLVIAKKMKYVKSGV